MDYKVNVGVYATFVTIQQYIESSIITFCIKNDQLFVSENTVSNDEVEVDLFNNIKLCDGTIEDNIVRRQVLSDVKKLVKHLPDSQREVLEMRS